MHIRVANQTDDDDGMIEVGGVESPDGPAVIEIKGLFSVDDLNGEHRRPATRFGQPQGHVTLELDTSTHTYTLKGELTEGLAIGTSYTLLLTASAGVTEQWRWNAGFSVTFQSQSSYRAAVTWSVDEDGQLVTTIAFALGLGG